MRRSLLYQIGSSEETPFERAVSEACLADELGIDGLWCFPTAGLTGDFETGAPEIWLAGIASRTKDIRLGWGLAAHLPPSRPPFRTAEQAASLDLASAGRLEIAFLPGIDPIPPSASPAVSGEEGLAAGADEGWDEAVRMLVGMWSHGPFGWHSEKFEVSPVDVLPKPFQNPHPPIWLAGWRPEHAERAGRGGMGFFDVSGAAVAGIEVHRTAYLEARTRAEPESLVCGSAFAAAIDLEPGAAGRHRVAEFKDLDVDEIVLHVGATSMTVEETSDRIRFLADIED